MLLGISKLIENPGKSVSFSFEPDFRDMKFGVCFPVQEPVLAVGVIRNNAGVLMLDGTVSTMLHGVCDRCAKPFVRKTEFPVHAILEADPDCADCDDIWTFAVENDQVDLEEIVRTAFVLGMGNQMLCRDDCKGLCFRCGADLNLGTCQCKPETDSRLDVLKALLKES